MIGPLSNFEIIGSRREGAVNIYTTKLNVNLKAMTIEELEAARKAAVLDFSSSLLAECRQLFGDIGEADVGPAPLRKFIDSQVAALVRGLACGRAEPTLPFFFAQVTAVGPEWFNETRNFRRALNGSFDAFTDAVRAGRDRVLQRASEEADETQAAALHRSAVLLSKRCSVSAEGDAQTLRLQSELVGRMRRSELRNSSATADELMALGDLQVDASQFSQAIVEYESALRIFCSLEGGESSSTLVDQAECRHRLGVV